MNNDRRKQLDNLSTRLYGIKREIDAKAADEQTGEAESSIADDEDRWSGVVDDLRSDLEEIKGEEGEYLENMPESLKGGDKGSQAEEAISAMGECLERMEELVNVEEEGAFTRLFHDKYDDMDRNLSDAAA